MVGCGTVNSSTPFHKKMVRADMYDTDNWFKANGQDVFFSDEYFKLTFLDGFSTTDFYRVHANDTRPFVFTMADCSPPGSIMER